MKKKFFLLVFMLSAAFCTANVIAADLILQGALNGYYPSDGNIYTQGTCTVEPESDAVLEAASTITLNQGFHAKPGSAFFAYIGQSRDSDTDGLFDWWELLYFGNLEQGPNDDPDLDQLTNSEEYQLGTFPNTPDTDGDGMQDNWEVQYGVDPLIANAADDDDNDGHSNYDEYLMETNPTNPGDPPTGNFYEYDELGRIKKIIRKK